MGYPDHSRRVSVQTQLGMSRNVLMWEDGSRGLDWIVSGTGADPVVAASSTYSFIGAKSIKLSTRSTSPADNDIGNMIMQFPYPVAKRLFVGTRVFVADVSTVERVEFRCRIYNGIRTYRATLLHVFSSGSYEYNDSSGVGTNFAAADGGVVDKCWMFLGVELDLNTFKYVKANFNGVEADLSAVSIQDAAASTDRYIEIGCQLKTQGAQQAHSYWDGMFASECECI